MFVCLLPEFLQHLSVPSPGCIGSLMIHSTSLESAETRRLRQDFLKHVRARPESVLKNARSMYATGNSASTPVKARGPPPLPEANGFAGRPPSPSLLNEVKFLVGNSAPSAGQSPPSVRISSAADAIVGTRANRPTSSAAALGAGDHRLLHASGVSIHGPHFM